MYYLLYLELKNMFYDKEEENENEVSHNPGQQDGSVYDPTTDEQVRCKDARCARCTRFQLDLCQGFQEGQ